MRKTALLPLALLLLVIIICTVFVGYFEKNSNFKRELVKTQTAGSKSLLNISGDNPFQNEMKNVPVNSAYAQKTLDISLSLVEAKKQLAKGNIEIAENMIKTLLIFHPNNIEALSLIGGIYYATGRYQNAQEVLEDISVLKPDRAANFEALGLVYEKQGNFEQALEEFMKSSLVKPDSALSYIHVAGIHSIIGNKGAAVENFQRAYELLGDRIYPFMFDPAYDNIRETPQFIVIMQRMNLTSKTQNPAEVLYELNQNPAR